MQGMLRLCPVKDIKLDCLRDAKSQEVRVIPVKFIYFYLFLFFVQGPRQQKLATESSCRRLVSGPYAHAPETHTHTNVGFRLN
jgi:hypothetical protein